MSGGRIDGVNFNLLLTDFILDQHGGLCNERATRICSISRSEDSSVTCAVVEILVKSAGELSKTLAGISNTRFARSYRY